LVSAPSIPQRVQVKNLPTPEADLDGEPSSAFVGSEPEGDVAALPELVDDPPAVEEAPEAVAPAEEEVAEIFVVEVGLLMPWTPVW
jgi:thioredoxin-like negative regulator of GroEL